MPLAGRPFTALAGELGELLARVATRPGHHGRIALIGILPTLSQAHLDLGMVTDAARYRALDRGLRRLRRGPFRIRIAGDEPLELTSEHVTLEGANTSFQVHLRVAPADFTRVYNAAQLATAPVLAAAGNSPMFLGRRLWEETRIALFKQSVEDRDGPGPRRGPAAGVRHGLVAGRRAGAVHRERPAAPAAAPVRQPRARRPQRAAAGRAQAAPGHGLALEPGHLRPLGGAPADRDAGPACRADLTDMLANAAFLIGLTLWLAGRDQRWTYALPFERADHGFYRAAQHGLAAELSWPDGSADGVRTVPAAELVPDCCPGPGRGCWARAWPRRRPTACSA